MDKYQEIVEEIVGLVESGAHRNMDLAHYLEVLVAEVGGGLTRVIECTGGGRVKNLGESLNRKYPKDTDSPLSAVLPSSPTVSTPDELDREFHYWRHVYPKRDGGQNWVGAKKVYLKLRRSGVSGAKILLGTQHYKRHLELRGKLRTEYVMMAATFLSRRGFDEEWSDEPPRRTGTAPPPPLPPSPKELMEQALQRRQASDSLKNGKLTKE